MEALGHFSEVTGLSANMEKASIFMAGVDDTLKKRILVITGFGVGQFPLDIWGFLCPPRNGISWIVTNKS